MCFGRFLLYAQRCKWIGRPSSHPLWDSWRVMTLSLLLLWHLVGSPIFLLKGWHGSFVGKKKRKRKVWRTTPFCLLWRIRKEWNQRTFEREQCTIQALKDSFITNMHMWFWGFLLGDGQGGLGSLLDFIEWLCSFS